MCRARRVQTSLEAWTRREEKFVSTAEKKNSVRPKNETNGALKHNSSSVYRIGTDLQIERED